MLRRVIARSILLRKRQLVTAASAVILAAALVSAFVTLSLQIKGKTGKELEAYGPNLLLTPAAVSLPAGVGGLAMGQVTDQGYIPQKSLDVLASGSIDGLNGYAPYLFTQATIDGQRIVAVGTFFDKLKAIAPYWQVEGEWVSDEASGRAIVGSAVAEKFSLRPGDRFNLVFSDGTKDFEVAGIAKVGGSEDNQVFIDLNSAQTLSGREGQLDLVQMMASAERRTLAMTVAELEKAIPGAEPREVRQIAEAQTSVLRKVQLLLALVTIPVLFAAAVAVFSTMTGNVLQRTKEIGLMKALGARNRQVALIFFAETWATGVVGGILGTFLGLVLAQVVAKSVFATYLSLQIMALPVTLLAALLLATLASLGPVRRALSVDPIVALRGE